MFGLSGVVAIPNGDSAFVGLGTAAWAEDDDCPSDVEDCITVTEKKKKKTTRVPLWLDPDPVSTYLLSSNLSSSELSGEDLAIDLCQSAKQSIAQFGILAGSVAVMRHGCTKLPDARAVTGCVIAVGGLVLVCAIVGDDD